MFLITFTESAITLTLDQTHTDKQGFKVGVHTHKSMQIAEKQLQLCIQSLNYTLYHMWMCMRCVNCICQQCFCALRSFKTCSFLFESHPLHINPGKKDRNGARDISQQTQPLSESDC